MLVGDVADQGSPALGLAPVSSELGHCGERGPIPSRSTAGSHGGHSLTRGVTWASSALTPDTGSGPTVRGTRGLSAVLKHLLLFVDVLTSLKNRGKTDRNTERINVWVRMKKIGPK